MQKKELADVLGNAGPVQVHAYSTVGLRADADICLWEIAEGPGPIQDLQARINATELGRLLRPTYSYLAMTRASQYLGGHRHEGQEDQMPAGPVGSTYLFVYPMVKKREWYALPFEERRRIMGAHFKTGHKYPGVKITRATRSASDDPGSSSSPSGRGRCRSSWTSSRSCAGRSHRPTPSGTSRSSPA